MDRERSKQKNRTFASIFCAMNMARRSAFKRFMVWRMKHVPDNTFVLLLSVLVGLVSGLAAVFLKTLVHVVSRGLLHFEVPTFVGGNMLMLIYPAVGIVLTILFVRHVVRGDIGHGLPSVLLAISRHKGQLPAKNMYSSVLASTLTVAFGGSVGLEAPIAATGSAIGSNIGRVFHLNTQHVKLLLGCGAAGAIASIFKAPLAGVLFVVEVFMFDLTMTSTIPLLISALSAASVAHFFMGQDVQFAFEVAEAYRLQQLPFYVLLGVVCACSSVYFLRTMDAVEGWFAKRRAGVRVVAGSVALGLLIFLFPPLFGEGYGFLSGLLHGSADMLFQDSVFASMREEAWVALAILFLLVPLKGMATAATIGSGGVGGTFAPSLMIGGISGYFVALLCNQLGLPEQSVANFALVGMAAVLSGVMHAPFMATFLIAEITGGYELLIPLLVAVVVCYICVHPFEKHSIYARKLAAQGNLMTHDKDSSAWHLLDLHRLVETNFVIVRQGDTLRDLVDAIQNSKRNIFPVLTSDDHFLGVVVLDDVRKIMFRTDLYDRYRVEDLMHSLDEGDVVRPSDSPTAIVNKFKIGNRYNLIVVDDDNNYIGFLSRANMFSAYRQFVSEVSEE